MKMPQKETEAHSGQAAEGRIAQTLIGSRHLVISHCLGYRGLHTDPPNLLSAWLNLEYPRSVCYYLCHYCERCRSKAGRRKQRLTCIEDHLEAMSALVGIRRKELRA